METYRLYPGKVRGLGNIITTRKFTDMELFRSGISPFSFTLIRGYYNEENGNFYSDSEFSNLIQHQQNQVYYDLVTSQYFKEDENQELTVITVSDVESSTIVDGVKIGVFRLGSASVPLQLAVEISELSVGFPGRISCTLTTVNEPILPVEGLEVMLYANDTLVDVSQTTDSEGNVIFNYPVTGDITDVDEVTFFRVSVSSQDGYMNVSKTVNVDIKTSSTPFITLSCDKTDLISGDVVTFTGTLVNSKNEPLGTIQKTDSQGNLLYDEDGFPIYEEYYEINLCSTGGSSFGQCSTDSDGNFSFSIPFTVNSHVVAEFIGKDPLFDDNGELIEPGYAHVFSDSLTIRTHSPFEELQNVLTSGEYSLVFDVFVADGITDYYIENDEIIYYDEGDLVVVTKSYDEINSFSDLEGAVVGIEKSSNGDWKLTKLSYLDVIANPEDNNTIAATDYYLDLILNVFIDEFGNLSATKLDMTNFMSEVQE